MTSIVQNITFNQKKKICASIIEKRTLTYPLSILFVSWTKKERTLTVVLYCANVVSFALGRISCLTPYGTRLSIQPPTIIKKITVLTTNEKVNRIR